MTTPFPTRCSLAAIILLCCISISYAQNANNITFTDRTNLLLTDNFSGVCMAIADMNADGKDDIVRYNYGRFLNIEYQNNPNQPFDHVYEGAIANASEWSTAIADVDRNGYNDILVGGDFDNIKLLYSIDGQEYTNTNIPNSSIFLQSSNFIDIDNDGWVDIFASNDVADNREYINNGAGQFSFTPDLINTTTVPISNNSGSYGSIWTDYDNDGDLDLYISKCKAGVTDPTDPRRVNMLLQNDGNGNFTETAAAAGLAIGAQSWMTDFADIDNDGDLDAFVGNHFDDCQLFLNNGNGDFVDITATSGLLPSLGGDSGVFAIQAIFRDFNNDGFVDLLFSGSNHFLFYNNGDRTFTQDDPFGSEQIESFALGDLNHDGFIDVYAGYADFFTKPSAVEDALFMNNGNSNNFIAVQLEGTESNVNAIGARVKIYGSFGQQIREVRAGEGFGIMNSYTQHFGIGKSTSVSRIDVSWPSGITQTVYNPQINQFHQIIEELPCAGETCDDGDTCTIDDIYDANCDCVGTLLDADNDGVCDTEDQCPGYNDNQDADNDGIPNGCDVCPNLNNNLIGQLCNDGDLCTTGERYDAYCGCSGGIYTDADNDGVCAGEDSNDSDPCVPDASSADCQNITNQDCEVLSSTGFEGANLDIWSDGGGSARLLMDANFAASGNFSFYLQGNAGASSSLYSAPQELSEYTSVLLSFTIFPYSVEAGDQFVVEVATNGATYSIYRTYLTNVDFTNEQHKSFVLNITGIGFTDNTRIRFRSQTTESGDYLMLDDILLQGCSDEVIGCNIGASCNDGDACTVGETYDANCNCTGGSFLDSDNDGICNAEDNCPDLNNNLIGQPCNDNDPCTEGETYDTSCGCSGGTIADNDGDGFCVGQDPNDNDPCVPNSDNAGCTSTGEEVADCNLLNFTGFENADLGIWLDGGSSARVVSGTAFSNAGNFGFYVQGNSGKQSSLIMQPQDFSGVEAVVLDFNVLPYSVENGDNFVVEVATNGNYVIYKTYNTGTDLVDYARKFIRLSIEDIPFSSTTSIRLRCRGNSVSDYFIFDDLRVETCTFDDSSGIDCTVGASCDDGNICTVGETLDANCDCGGGTFMDSDSDGVCNAEDNCPAFNNNLIGQPCDDGNNCTTGETYDNNCGCSGGTYTDADEDGFCVGNDADDNDPCVPNVTASNCDPATVLDCIVVNSTDFESGNMGVWRDGGNSARLFSGATYSNSGAYSFYIHGNRGAGSSLYSLPMDLSSYSAIQLKFHFFAYSVEVGDKFYVELDNGSGSYSVLKTYQYNQAFVNGDRIDVVEIFDNINFSSATRLRFRAATTEAADYIILDDISVEGCQNGNEPSCQIGSACNDNDPCTIGSTLDTDCNCTGGFIVDGDNDGFCAANDTDDNDPCVPNANSPGCNTTTDVSCDMISSVGFENNDLGIWNDGGGSARILNSAAFASEGTYSFYIQGNSDSQSSLYSDPLDLEGVGSMRLSFDYLAYSVEAGDRFYVELSTGGNYFVYETYIFGVDFHDNDRKEVVLDITGVNFSSTTRFRFRMQGTIASDYIMLDEVKLEVCEDDKEAESRTRPLALSDAVQISTEQEMDFVIYPNPTSGLTHVVLANGQRMADGAVLHIYDLQGRKVMQENLVSGYETIDISALPANQVYLFRMTAQNGMDKSYRIFKN